MDKSLISFRQTGMVLMVSLIFLVLLTLLAVSAMHGTILQERMAGNTRDRMLAFQAAEMALRAGDALLGNPGLPPNGPGIYMGLNSSPAATYTSVQQWDTAYPWATSAATISGSLQYVAQQPRYVIERLSTTASCGPLPKQKNLVHTGEGYYRITSRGVGGSTNAAVILQEIYVRCS
ncbi:hypothetical protein TPL01_23320 [Sulfuriferula plumbiphila]|uniref:Type 4 fimbrial biogenesis protein PilX N-terminal domain-containing protein n=1 Tax=Sulfuriferula plumbiphila TaxID=171865 RepID=A0A512L9N1_9PROT|nr:PilX N-terminal domain-containing pilus assembly protein [Sulfuriferula plumbiphila]BBP03684.1 hypothetical protein SFPGR_11060 [Sulfuriferula plumbiphila]GEP31194.1 hypothetical protein TPL01_23320 [Sulfuriferula plumbiphila]